jgi:hypothetical protein
VADGLFGEFYFVELRIEFVFWKDENHFYVPRDYVGSSDGGV